MKKQPFLSGAERFNPISLPLRSEVCRRKALLMAISKICYHFSYEQKGGWFALPRWSALPHFPIGRLARIEKIDFQISKTLHSYYLWYGNMNEAYLQCWSTPTPSFSKNMKSCWSDRYFHFFDFSIFFFVVIAQTQIMHFENVMHVLWYLHLWIINNTLSYFFE